MVKYVVGFYDVMRAVKVLNNVGSSKGDYYDALRALVASIEVEDSGSV